MNERDFYDESANDDFFRDYLNDKSEFPRKRENWLKVAAILDQKQEKKRFWRWFWLVFLLASGNVWQAYRAFRLTQSVSAPLLTQSVRDTVFQHDTIYTYIYSRSLNAIGLGDYSIISPKDNYTTYNSDNNQHQKIINQNESFSSVIRKPLSNSIGFLNSTYISTLNQESIELIAHAISMNANDYTDFNSKIQIINYQKDSLNDLRSKEQQKKGLPTLPLENKPLELLPISKLYTETIRETIENLDKPIIRRTQKSSLYIKPIGVGIQQGLSKWARMPKNINFAHWQGLNSDFTFTKNLTFGLSMDYAKLSYKIFERPNDGEPLRLPTEPTNIGSDFKLEYIEGQVQSWHLGLDLKYALPIFPKWHPFITTGYQYRVVLPNKTEFEYKNKWTNDEKSVKILTQGLVYDHWWFAGVGYSKPIYQTWNLQMSAKYIYDNHHGNRPLHYGLLQAGLFYRF